jgi:hypothetical protein
MVIILEKNRKKTYWDDIKIDIRNDGLMRMKPWAHNRRLDLSYLSKKPTQK